MTLLWCWTLIIRYCFPNKLGNVYILAMPSNDTTPFFSECLDHVRWVSAFVVLIGHTRNAFYLPFRQISEPTIYEYIFYGLTNLQNEAVLFFFVISGYLIGGKLLQYYRDRYIPIAKYVIDRLVRLYIVLIPSVVLAAFTQFNDFCHGKDGWETFGGNLLFVQHILVPKLKCNIPLWSLANEFWYYAFGLLIVVFLVSSKRTALIILVICISILIFDDFNQEHVLAYFLAWVAGVGLMWSTEMKKIDPGIFVSSAVMISTLFLSRSHLADELFLIRDLIVVFGAFCLLMSARNLDASTFAPRFGRFMASFSFSLYLTHWSIMRTNSSMMSAVNFQPDDSLAAIIFIGSCATCLLFAYSFSLLTERNTNSVRVIVTALIFDRQYFSRKRK
jgi:peptidoglycan/LPS O-acetylase OafA/YrhL